MFANYTAKARNAADTYAAGDRTAAQILELVGQIADQDTRTGEIDTKIELIAVLLARHSN